MGLFAGAGIPLQQPVTDTDIPNQKVINDNQFIQEKSVNGPWIAFKPVLVPASVAPGFAYGTGASQFGKWKKIGALAFVNFEIRFGTPGFTSGTGAAWELALPLPAAGYFPANLSLGFGQNNLGSVWIRRGAALNEDMHVAIPGSTTPNGLQCITCTFLRPLVGSGTRLAGTSGWDQNALMQGNLVYETLP